MMEVKAVLEKCEEFIAKKNYASYDPFDALTNKFIHSITSKNLLLKRLAIQFNSKTPIDIHWIGMRKMVHTKTISDMLWYHSICNNPKKAEKVNYFFTWLLKLKNSEGYGWGLNFPYTSRFINASADMPNLYNTINSAIAICYSINHLGDDNKALAEEAVKGTIHFIEKNLGYVNEGKKGWYLYYPGQKHPTYNVNALTLYFLSFAKKLKLGDMQLLDNRINSLVTLLCDEQQADGSWVYSRSEKGKWVDGFHSGFILESLAFAIKENPQIDELEKSLKSGWRFFIKEMFTNEGYPKYFLNSTKYPIEAQNCAQAIQTLANIGKWLGWEERDLLLKVIRITIDNLYDKKGYLYHKKTKFFIYKSAYIRWSITPIMLALAYSEQFLVKDYEEIDLSPIHSSF